jgi:energy-coupling factor transporter ATP-binding protein EcfA2
MIEATGLTKRYGRTLAVDGLSFQVRPGRVTGFLGPNGAGKSTTMRLILGLDAPTGGGVTVNGGSCRELPAPLWEVEALPDARAVHGGRTAHDHLLWLATPPEEPHLQIEGVLRDFYANLAGPADLHRSVATTAEQAGSMLGTLRGFVGEYLAEGGPMDMLEQGIGGAGARRAFAGRTMFPERLPGVALTLDITTRLLEEVERFFAVEAATVRQGQLADPPATRHRLEEILLRAEAAEDHIPSAGRDAGEAGQGLA